MSLFILCPQQREDETPDDFLTRLAYDAFRGEGDAKQIARMTIMLRALNELDSVSEDEEPYYDENGARQTLSSYNHPESIRKEIELNPYGYAPSQNHRLMVVDSFAVLGRFGRDRSYAGFILDYFKHTPARTITFVQESSHDLVGLLANQAFGLQNIAGGEAYRNLTVGEKVVGLEHYAGQRDIDAMVEEGEIWFGGNGRKQGEMIGDVLDRVEAIPGFFPRKYALRCYQFSIDFGVEDGEEAFHRGVQELGQRMHRVYEEKRRAA